MSFLDRMFGGYIPPGTDERDKEALLRQLYLSMGAQLMGGAFSGKGGASMTGALSQLGNIGPMARDLQDRRSQQEYYELQRENMRRDEARKAELHPYNVKNAQGDLEADRIAREANELNLGVARDAIWDADDDIEIANAQRQRFIPELEAALVSVQDRLAPEQVNELRSRIGEIQSMPNEALTTEYLRKQRSSFYTDAEAYARGERTAREAKRRTDIDDARMRDSLNLRKGATKITNVPGGKHLQVQHSDGTIEWVERPPEVSAGQVDQAAAIAGARAEAVQEVTNLQGKQVTLQMVQAAHGNAMKAIAASRGYRSTAELTKAEVDEAHEIAMRDLNLTKSSYAQLIGSQTTQLQDFINAMGQIINQ